MLCVLSSGIMGEYFTDGEWRRVSVLEARLFVDVQLIWGAWFYFQGLLLWTLVLSPPKELRWLRALDALDCELLLDMRLDMRPAVNTHERWAWVWLPGWQPSWSADSDSAVLLSELLGMRISSRCSWILASSSSVNLHLFSAACDGCCGTELFFLFDEVGEAKHEVGMEPVVIPSGNFWAITLRPGRGQRNDTENEQQCWIFLFFPH